MAVAILVLLILFFVLLFLVFRPPMPGLDRLLAFVALLAVTAVLGLLFAIKVFNFNPDPYRFNLARRLTQNKVIDLTQFVPGLAEDLRLIQRVDTDWEDETPKEEWLVFYQYDVATADVRRPGAPRGPYGAAIYDVNRCRPPAVQSYELVPVSYDYLGQDWLTASVEEIIPAPQGITRPEVILNGQTLGVVTDVNIFRKEGIEPDCSQGQAWRETPQGQACPYPVYYKVIGSFRGNYLVQRAGSTVSVYDRAGFERSQIVLRRKFEPDLTTGTYFVNATSQTLRTPAEFGLEFGPGWPDNIPQVYYPEKAVLAFYLSLTGKAADLERAKNYLSENAQQAYNIKTRQFGISMPRSQMDHAVVVEIRYEPNVEEERAHKTRQVTVVVVGVDANGKMDTAHPCQVTWEVVGVSNPGALPYGCEWRLDTYTPTTCPESYPSGEREDGGQFLSQVAP